MNQTIEFLTGKTQDLAPGVPGRVTTGVVRQERQDVAPGPWVPPLDLQLKTGTGLGVLKGLGSAPRPRNAKIIVFTNYAFPQYRERSIALGADFFFDKSREFHRVREVLAGMAGGPAPMAH